jgi:hypothetical protein
MPTNHVSDVVKAADPETVLRTNTRDSEDSRSVDGDARSAYMSVYVPSMKGWGQHVHSHPLLQYLKPYDELDTSSSVQFAGADAEQHGQVALLVGSLVLHVADVDDVLQLRLSSCTLLSLAATKTLEDKPGFLLAADLDQPSWTLGHEPDPQSKKYQRDNLEGNGESPDK